MGKQRLILIFWKPSLKSFPQGFRKSIVWGPSPVTWTKASTPTTWRREGLFWLSLWSARMTRTGTVEGVGRKAAQSMAPRQQGTKEGVGPRRHFYRWHLSHPLPTRFHLAPVHSAGKRISGQIQWSAQCPLIQSHRAHKTLETHFRYKP